MTGPEWVMSVMLPSWGIMALGGGLWALGGYGLQRRAVRPWWRVAAAAGLFVVLMGMAFATRGMPLQWASILAIEFIAVALAFWKAGWAERFVATSELLISITSGICQIMGWFPHDLPAVAWKTIAVVCAQLLLLLFVVGRARRYWVLWATSAQVLGLMVAVVSLSPGAVSTWAWGMANNFWVYVFDAVVLFGIAQHWWETEIAPQLPPARQRATGWAVSVRPVLVPAE